MSFRGCCLFLFLLEVFQVFSSIWEIKQEPLPLVSFKSHDPACFQEEEFPYAKIEPPGNHESGNSQVRPHIPIVVQTLSICSRTFLLLLNEIPKNDSIHLVADYNFYWVWETICLRRKSRELRLTRDKIVYHMSLLSAIYSTPPQHTTVYLIKR